jgi:hypothetical protein
MKKSLRILSALSIVASSILFVPSASAIGTLYNGTSGDVACTTGFFTILNNAVTGNTLCSGSVQIPSGVTSVDAYALSNSATITSVSIPASVTLIGNFGFANLTNLVSLTIASGLSLTLNYGAFFNATSLTSLTIPSSVTSFGTYVFFGLTSLTSLSIPNSVTAISNGAFSRLSSLTSLTIPNSVTSIGDEAFMSASSLTSLTIPSSVTSIGEAAFRYASSLTSLTIPSSVSSISVFAFANATALSTYQYCGTLLTSSNLSNAGLGSKTISGCAPTITISTAPTSVVATATGKRSATVIFAAPASDGGSAVTSYTATSTPGGITKTLTQATGGTFTFDGLEPNTSYTFAVTATNAIGTSAAATSNSIKTLALDVASISALSFADDGTGTGGKIVWSGKSIDAVLYTGSSAYYPGPYNYGAFSSGWNGRIRNLTPGTEYTVSLFVVSADGVGESKSLTFKTSATLPALPGASSSTTSQADQMSTQLPKLNAWINENVFVEGEGDRMKMMIDKFDAATVPAHSAYLKLPNSSVVRVSASSSTPLVCMVEGQLTVRSIAAGTCTISYTVSGGSKAPATMVKDFVFKKFG